MIDRSAFHFRLQGAYIDKDVDSFFYNYAGGLIGMKGYSYYSIEGTKMLIGTARYRFPLKRNIRTQIGPWYFQRLYGGVSYHYGNAWVDGGIKFNDFKKSVVLETRMDMMSFYSYPTKIAFDAAYAFDEFQGIGGTSGKEWRFYVTVLLSYF